MAFKVLGLEESLAGELHALRHTEAAQLAGMARIKALILTLQVGDLDYSHLHLQNMAGAVHLYTAPFFGQNTVQCTLKDSLHSQVQNGE